ncbi:MAG: TIGR03619 family F420-dependent LLM class oxidoreductase [Actinomycetota bacterium]|jgi:probable F420-dependent oxidoreductase|nr:TIGR03619 family F420-dependent LLM class oxidoreductase [Actinomycetota bacterium]
MRFHQALSFLPIEQVVPLSTACDAFGYAGVYLSDHLFNPRDLDSRYTYSERQDGAPSWDKETGWPDPMCVFSALATVTHTLTFTTGVYVAPVRDLVTVAKSVGTAAVLSGDRVRLGVGVGWCREEFQQTGQDFSTRGRRLDEMITALRSLWSGGWVEHHGRYYDVPPCQMNPSPSHPVPILGGGHSEPALRRAATLCDGWIAAGAYQEEEAWAHLAELRRHLEMAGRADEHFDIYLSLAERPDVDLYRKFEEAGVSDMVCAPWMFTPVPDGASPDEVLAARIGACEWFADHFVSAMP